MTTENNKLIAEFMGFKLQDNPNERFYNKWVINSNAYGGRYNFEEFYFDVDWNWLMQVVEKIKSLVSESEFNYRIGKHLLNLNIEGVYNGCVAFIKWYNTQILEVITNKTKNKFGNEK